ncbi:uncharacterized protein FOMMEDRAFT_30637 [Fomitiporia mediterranea MF3/22]|uniref:uncharacterized protein n=1 Tax=Fomitiporia mediterranea (strain MF3/22) TaxID=694068 RepID=UPI00044084D4|nr:uncharacterized protein FOMMEDRAFT_30637 [Fomitiporia mediterranea MF3/22]EJD00677.1 hypothetical protein FOMMEDRAFT_30637 [Fomitiporia mediterranea MF3/22]
MKFALAPVTALVAVVYAQQPFTVDTPADAVQCQNEVIEWTGGAAPFEVDLGGVTDHKCYRIVSAANPNGPALVDLGEQQGTSVLWDTNVPAGTSVAIKVQDSQGDIAQTAPFTIQASDNNGCL